MGKEETGVSIEDVLKHGEMLKAIGHPVIKKESILFDFGCIEIMVKLSSN